MPTSDLYNIHPVVTAIQQLEPSSVLDVGCGFGKYGVLLREYLDVWHSRVQPDEWTIRVEAIEGFDGYRNPLWDFVYDKVHGGDALTLIHDLGSFDVILIADVIEHFEKAAAQELVGSSLDRARAVVISTPRHFFAQGASNENPYEIHRCLWSAADFPSDTHVRTIPALSCNVYVASRSPLPRFYPVVPEDFLYLRSREKLKRLGPVGWLIARTVRALNALVS